MKPTIWKKILETNWPEAAKEVPKVIEHHEEVTARFQREQSAVFHYISILIGDNLLNDCRGYPFRLIHIESDRKGKTFNY